MHAPGSTHCWFALYERRSTIRLISIRPDTGVCPPSDAATFLVSSVTEAPNDP
jgi:hypothetical protein